MTTAYASTAVLTELQSESKLEVQITKQATVLITRATAGWKAATRIAFRFFFAYFALYVVAGFVDWPWSKIVPWVGQHVLRLGYTMVVGPNGSGDTTFDYVQLLVFAVLAAVATFVWTILDRKRSNYEKLYPWLKLTLRLFLGAALLAYGAVKLIPTQMPVPSLARLTQTYGESSPMGLLWTFMGASKSYESFAGSCEMLAGILLFLPASATLGALLSIGVLTNVFMLNMSYDVPVKLFSFHLLLMSVFLAAPDLRRLAQLFLFRREAKLAADRPLFKRKWLNRVVLGLQLAIGLFVMSLALYTAHDVSKAMSEKVGPQLYGIWSVEEYAVDGKVVPSLATNPTQWQRVFFENPTLFRVQTINGQTQKFPLKLDEAKKTLTLTRFEDQGWKADLSFEKPQSNLMVLSGQIDGHRIVARLQHVDTPKVLLTTRGFHWINEHPFNR